MGSDARVLQPVPVAADDARDASGGESAGGVSADTGVGTKYSDPNGMGTRDADDVRGVPATQGTPGVVPATQGTPGGSPATPGDVYRPSFDFSTGSSHTSTPTPLGFDSFSLEDLGFDTLGAPATLVQGGAGRGRGAPKKKGKKKVGESSQPGEEDVRRRWTDEENVALCKAWVSVCDDPLVSNEQRIVNMWGKIAAAYMRFCPEGRPRNGEDCRKAWNRIRAAVSRFSGLYTNALRMMSSGQTEEDCRRIAEKAFPLKGVYKDFTYWNCYLVLNESEKFRVGVESGWPKKQRLNYTGDFSGSSGGSHDLPETTQEFPTPRSFGGRPRPIGRKRAQREARGVAGGSQEVQSASPLANPPRISDSSRVNKRALRWSR